MDKQIYEKMLEEIETDYAVIDQRVKKIKKDISSKKHSETSYSQLCKNYNTYVEMQYDLAQRKKQILKNMKIDTD